MQFIISLLKATLTSSWSWSSLCYQKPRINCCFLVLLVTSRLKETGKKEFISLQKAVVPPLILRWKSNYVIHKKSAVIVCNILFLFQGVYCLFLILGLFSLTRFCTSEAAGQCTTQFPIYGKALIGHVFASAPSISPVRCFVRCQREKICQSLNYVTTEHICELNNRTKEAQPQKLITDPARLHLTNGPLMRGWIGSSFIAKNTSNKMIVPYQYGHQII